MVDMAAQQRAAAAKAKQKAAEDELAKANPALAAAKKRQAAKIKAKQKGAATPGKGKNAKSGRESTKDGKKGKKTGRESADGEEATGDGAAKEETKEKEVKEKVVEKKVKKKVKKEQEEVRELPPDQNPVDQEWTAAGWLHTLAFESVISAALKPPAGDGQGAAFDYVRGLSRDKVETMLQEANLGGLLDVLWEGIEALRGQSASTAFVLNNTKFKQEGRFEMAYGALALFYGGLESLIGPPQMVDGSLIKSMEQEHTVRPDSTLKFTSSNGMSSISKDEWEVAYEPIPEKISAAGETPGPGKYAERVGFPDEHPEWCRKVVPITEFEGEMDKINRKLGKEGHALLITEELLGGRLYTGPMYHKYNHVLRAKSGNGFICDMYRKMCKDNQYPTTIHAINSLIIKLSKLTVATKVYRGFCYAKLPDSFWARNTEGIRCGIEYGFSSTTSERSVAVHYGTGPAGTIFEMQMGLVDRGAELVWISQYPHEAEILFPPLTGLEMAKATVMGNELVVDCRLSVNLTALTLEQVVSKRRKMIMDMGDGMMMEIREELKDKPDDAEAAITLLRKGLEAGPYSYSPKWYNDDENFSRCVSMSLGLKKTVILDGIKLPQSQDERQPILAGSFKGFRPDRSNHQRILLMAAWLKNNPKVATLDLRAMALEQQEVEFLCYTLQGTQFITALDMRENGEMGATAAQMLVDDILKPDDNTVGSLCGVTKTKISLTIPRKDNPETDLIFISTELEANSWAESNGGKGKPFAEIRRRSSHSYGDWSPLLFAAREGILELCSMLIKRGADVNQKDQDKLNPGYTALITAATRGDVDMCKLLVEADADLSAGDRNGKTALMLADQRSFTEVVEYLDSKTDKTAEMVAEGEKGEESKAEEGGAAKEQARRGSVAASGGMYKGLQEKAEKKEMVRLSAAAQLADQRYEKWQAAAAEAAAAIAREAAAKAECDEAMKAQAAIANGKGRRGSAVGANAAAMMALLPGAKPAPSIEPGAAQRIMMGTMPPPAQLGQPAPGTTPPPASSPPPQPGRKSTGGGSSTVRPSIGAGGAKQQQKTARPDDGRAAVVGFEAPGGAPAAAAAPAAPAKAHPPKKEWGLLKGALMGDSGAQGDGSGFVSAAGF